VILSQIAQEKFIEQASLLVVWVEDVTKEVAGLNIITPFLTLVILAMFFYYQKVAPHNE
jgi:hypothetical protein